MQEQETHQKLENSQNDTFTQSQTNTVDSWRRYTSWKVDLLGRRHHIVLLLDSSMLDHVSMQVVGGALAALLRVMRRRWTAEADRVVRPSTWSRRTDCPWRLGVRGTRKASRGNAVQTQGALSNRRHAMGNGTMDRGNSIDAHLSRNLIHCQVSIAEQ